MDALKGLIPVYEELKNAKLQQEAVVEAALVNQVDHVVDHSLKIQS